MYYWKTFLAMCVTCWVITLACIVLVILGILNIVHLNVGLWIFLIFFLIAMIMGSMVCKFIMEVEVKERREERDNRKSSGRC